MESLDRAVEIVIVAERLGDAVDGARLARETAQRVLKTITQFRLIPFPLAQPPLVRV